MADRVVVVGGNAAGLTAASRAKRLNPELDVLVLELSHFISYSICGVPHYISGIVGHHEDLTRFNSESLKAERGIDSRLRVQVTEIQPSRRVLVAHDLSADREFEVPYDQAVLATGYVPRVPNIEGFRLQQVLTLSKLEDGLALRQLIEHQSCHRVVVIGGGYIGLMMVSALSSRGLEVTLVERERHLLSRSVDEDIAQKLESRLRSAGIQLMLRAQVGKLIGEEGRVKAVEINGIRSDADVVLIDIGVEPNTRLAQDSGIACGISGAIQVDERGLTSAPGVFAAGNCAQTKHLISGRSIYSTLGTTAVKQGRVVGENIAGLRSHFMGTLETSVEPVLDLVIGRTGLTFREALALGYDADTVLVSANDRAGYYPGREELLFKLVFEGRSGRLLGAQLLGSERVSKRIDVLVTALTAGMTISQLAQLDLAYAPSVATLWDPIQIAANLALRKQRQ